MGDEKTNYKASELNENDEKKRINNICNEYGYNLGNRRKSNNNVFDSCLKLKHFNRDIN